MLIMVVDDEESLCSALSMILTSAGYKVVCAQNAQAALDIHARSKIDLAVLDVMLPGMDGVELCAALRCDDATLPILMLSAKSDIVDKKHGFHAGADDYLGKPFNEDELLLRVKALLRRSHHRAREIESNGQIAGSESAALVFGDLTVDPLRAEVRLDETLVQLTRKEYEIVKLMAKNPGIVFTKEDIIDEVWGSEYQGAAISIPTHIRHIRTKLEKDPAKPQLIQIVFGFGYRLGS